MRISSFAPNSPSLYSSTPLSDDQIRLVAPSIFAQEAHRSRSDRYAYIETAKVLEGLRREGFQPFFVAQTRVRDESRREYTKHMLRFRHPSSARDAESGEVVLLNSHDGSSSYQLLAGMLRFVCTNGLVCGDVVADVRIPHKGPVVNRVIEGAFEVLDGMELVREVRDDMRALTLNRGEEQAFARAALALKYEPTKPAPVTEAQILAPRRTEDGRTDLWTTFNRVQENLVRGGLEGRTALNRRTRTRAVTGIDQGLKLNRGLWVLAEEMLRLKA